MGSICKDKNSKRSAFDRLNSLSRWSSPSEGTSKCLSGIDSRFMMSTGASEIPVRNKLEGHNPPRGSPRKFASQRALCGVTPRVLRGLSEGSESAGSLRGSAGFSGVSEGFRGIFRGLSGVVTLGL